MKKSKLIQNHGKYGKDQDDSLRVLLCGNVDCPKREKYTVKNEKYDLSIKKFITNIGGKEITNREPKVEVAEDGKVTYKLNDEIEKTSNNENVTYTIRMYNESNVRAKGKQVIEYVPNGLVFVPEDEVNKGFNWIMCKVDSEGNVTVTENPEENL